MSEAKARSTVLSGLTTISRETIKEIEPRTPNLEAAQTELIALLQVRRKYHLPLPHPP